MALSNINLTVYGSNGTSFAEGIQMGFPASGILITQLTSTPTYAGTACASQVQVIASSTLYYVEETVGDLIDLINGA